MAIGGNSGVPAVESASAFMLEYGRFEAAHKQQLEALDLPKHLWQTLYKKIANSTFDIGEYVVFYEPEGASSTDNEPNGLIEHRLCLNHDKLDEFSTVFLVDHAWTTTIDKAADELNEIPDLLDRMERLTGIYESTEKVLAMSDADSIEATVSLNVPIVASQAGVSEEKARDLLKRTSGDIIEAIMIADDESSGAISEKKDLQSKILEQLSEGDEQDGAQPLEWSTRKYSCVQYSLDGSDKLDAIDIRIPIASFVTKSDVRCVFAAKHLRVSISDNDVIGGSLYADICPDEATWVLENGMLSVSLVKKTAAYWPVAIVGEQHITPIVHKKHIQRVCNDLWRYFQGYDYLAQSLNQNTFIKRTNWYVQDEVGLSIEHSSQPNVRSLPFIYLDNHGRMTPFSIVWPIKPILKSEVLSRDYCPRWLTDRHQRKGYLHSIFKGSTQFALDAYKDLVEKWAKVAASASRKNLTSLSVPKSQAKRVYISDYSIELQKAIEEAGLELTNTVDAADIVFDDTASISGKPANQHPLNRIFGSIEHTVAAFQSVAGAQEWLCAGFDLKTQICEFIGAALMDNNSWWILASNQSVHNIQSPKILTNNWVTAVRHIDVGYTLALKCAPPAIAFDQLYVVEKKVLLTPDNSLYIWNKNTKTYSHTIQTKNSKPSPYQTLAPASEIPGDILSKLLLKHFGSGAMEALERDIRTITADIVRLMLGSSESDGTTNFGLFSFSFMLGKYNGAAMLPFIYEVKPVSFTHTLKPNEDAALVSAVATALAGKANPEYWDRVRNN
ncbi:hypothetical protein GGI25_000520 [Coemansia spiralis]|uniref:CS domain-containing protein n=2 Tax=Coemansia TaxID=4863 RepID=A0A9W8GCF9_9FUNG|nr:hypothetical protein BX070DRAFT_228627 [Coemansia spiralis]KAJ1995980.1 hypothetical protein EDC05_000348 [Coemansia umbellata]KAJ2625424.1 hypothetical protein GGI26_000564 [Coemansia sp. RSA 1358]KAJ2680547.1 hypothetical protein GGI25_000520 [Coemansia spiralis]